MADSRELKKWADAHLCDVCKRDDDPAIKYTLATHSVTDAQETEPGVFMESAPRYGCGTHKVASMVYTLDGKCTPFSQYEAA